MDPRKIPFPPAVYCTFVRETTNKTKKDKDKDKEKNKDKNKERKNKGTRTRKGRTRRTRKIGRTRTRTRRTEGREGARVYLPPTRDNISHPVQGRVARSPRRAAFTGGGGKRDYQTPVSLSLPFSLSGPFPAKQTLVSGPTLLRTVLYTII